MKTSKEMQLKIIDKMRENVESDNPLFKGLYRNQKDEKYILNGLWEDSFNVIEHGVLPETITINGVEIPKPLTREEFEVRSDNDVMVYYPKPHSHLYGPMYAELHDFKEGDIFYDIPSIAIEASKLLFGIKD